MKFRTTLRFQYFQSYFTSFLWEKKFLWIFFV